MDSGTDIVVSSGQTTANINASLALNGGGGDPYTDWANGFEWGDAPSGPDDDADGDGFTNDQERIAGTDPLSAGDFFEIAQLVMTPARDGIVLGTAVPGRVYSARYTTDLRLPWDDWTPVTLTIEDNPIIAPIPPDQTRVIFRIAVELE